MLDKFDSNVCSVEKRRQKSQKSIRLDKTTAQGKSKDNDLVACSETRFYFPVQK